MNTPEAKNPWYPRTGPLGTLLGFRKLDGMYREVPDRADPFAFLRAALSSLGVSWEVRSTDLARIPDSGPLLVVANHPFGGLEGMVLLALLGEVRRDVRLVGNHWLSVIPELAPLLVAVDPFGRREMAGRNAVGLRAALRWLRQGGCVLMFPAGEVAHLRLWGLRVTESRWRESFLWLWRQSQARLSMVYFPGANGPLFQVLGLLHPWLRTALLPRQLVKGRGKKLRVFVGEPLRCPPGAGDDPRREAQRLRGRTLILGFRGSSKPSTPRDRAPLAPLPPQAAVAREVASLPPERVLVERGEYLVGWTEAAATPSLFDAIAVLREATFRGVGEGTGKPEDRDAFDGRYLHLFVYHRAAQEVVGAYRLGPTDRILASQGLPGLYTSTLFRFAPQLFEALGPALELGRSFVVPQYQREYAPLFLLWRGIGEFVVRHPQYRYLFGPVSVSAEYHLLSRSAIAAYCRQHLWDSHLARWVRPRRPFVPARQTRQLGTPRDLDELEWLVAHLEADRKGVPVLLRQYLKLGARVLALNVDPAFSHVLDALVLVDLVRTEPAILRKYMGASGSASFLRFHGQPVPAEDHPQQH